MGGDYEANALGTPAFWGQRLEDALPADDPVRQAAYLLRSAGLTAISRRGPYVRGARGVNSPGTLVNGHNSLFYFFTDKYVSCLP